MRIEVEYSSENNDLVFRKVETYGVLALDDSFTPKQQAWLALQLNELLRRLQNTNNEQ